MAIQTEYDKKIGVAHEGGIVNIGVNNIDTLTPNIDIPFGRAVVHDDTLQDEACTLHDGKGNFRGITCQTSAGQVDKVHLCEAQRPASLITLGKVWVRTNFNIKVGDPVYYNTQGDIGSLRNDDAENAIKIERAFFITSGAPGELVQVLLQGI